MRSDRPSLTASLVAALRALYTEMPEPYRLTSDPLAADLVPIALALPARAVAAVPAAAASVHHALGLVSLGVTYHVPLRTRAIDDAIRGAVADGATQLVVLGAGLDNRAMRMSELAGVSIFEVDHPSTQRYKLERLTRAAAPPPRARALVRVAVDFERDSLEEALPAAGLLRTKTTMWVWEGVTVYLTDEAISETLRVMAALSAPGSRIALTYSLPAATDLPPWVLSLAEGAFRLAGEPLRSPLSAGAMAARLSDAGFDLRSDEATPDWAARYWPGQRGVRPIERLAVAARRADAAVATAAS